MKRIATTSLVSILAGLCGTAGAMEVPKDLAGRYAPGGDCGREPRLIVDGQGITVQTGGKQSNPKRCCPDRAAARPPRGGIDKGCLGDEIPKADLENTRHELAIAGQLIVEDFKRRF